MIIIAVAVLLSLLFLGAVALVVLKFRDFAGAEAVLKADKDRLQILYSRNPFPSPANLKLERENITVIKQELVELQGAMGTGQVEPVVQRPERFITQFFETQRDLLTRATSSGITVPKMFDFGFGRHMKGDLPATIDVPRLTQQLKIVETLCLILYNGNISSLDALSRQEFEVDAAPGAKPAAGAKGKPAVSAGEIDVRNVVDPGAGLVPSGQLYGRWRFQVQFKGRESAVMKILNGLACSSIFAVVTRVEIKGEDKLFDRKEGGGAKEAAPEGATEKETIKSRDYRVVCGRENILTVKMDLDVYQFAKTQAPAPEKHHRGAK
jgi:hypothetical protein